MPETLAAVRVGLLTKDKAPVPLTGVVVNAEISTLCARVTVTQRYVNREATPIEAVYVFPLDEGAAVCGFEALIDGTLVVGEVKERESAFRTYDEAMERGHGAYLLDEERPDVFQASVGNLPPGKEVLLKLTYVTELAVEGRQIRFTIPTTVSPRYAPAEDRIGVGRPDSDTLNPPVEWRVPYGLDLRIAMTTSGAVGKIASPSHPVAVEVDGNNATVTLSQRDAALDRDFVLLADAAGLDTPRAWIERDDHGADAIAVAFVPRLPDATAPAEIVFLVDRSGSMEGQSIAEVRNALQLCLRSMIPGCSFNIVGFGSRFETLFEKSRPYDERSLREASEHVTRLEANLGGTEILPALQHVFQQPPAAGLARQVVILTDGEVTNTDALLALVAEHASNTRIFTFGIGASASHHLVKGLARAGGGVAEFIHPGERIEAKVVRQFGRLLSPALTDVRLEWHGVDVTQAPSTFPPIFSGGRLLIYGLLKQAHAGDAVRATLSAHAPTGDVSFDVAIDPSGVRQGRTIAPLAARTRIRELEESPEWTKARGSRQSDRRKSSVTQEIVELSTRYGVISRETSFVAVERRETPVEGEIQLRKVPIALAAGWGGLDMADTAPPMLSAMRVAPAAARSGGVLRDMMALSSTMFGSRERASQIPETVGKADALPSSPRNQNDRVTEDPLRKQLMALIVLQRADGSWEMSSELQRLIGHDSFRPGLQIADATPLMREFRDVWATALALAWLQRDAGRLQPEWEMVAEKGRRWLQDAVEKLGDGGRWVHEAMRFV